MNYPNRYPPGTDSPSTLTAVEFLSDKVSHQTKKANNWRWVEVRADYINRSHTDKNNQEYVDDVDDNFRLMSGGKMVNYKKVAKLKAKRDEINLRQEGIDLPVNELEHYDSVSWMLEGKVGDRQRQPLTYTVTDSSLYTQNFYKSEEDRLLTAFFQQTIIEPAQAKAIRMWQERHGISDIFSLPPQERQQFEQEVNQQTQALTPKEIQRYLKYGAKGKYEETAMALADYYVNTANGIGLKYLADYNYRLSLGNDAYIFYQGIRRDEVVTEIVDPRYFQTGGTPDIFINNNSWFKRTRWMSVWDVWTEFSDSLPKKDQDKFFRYVNETYAGGDWKKEDENSFVINIGGDELKELAQQNTLTVRGQYEYDKLFKRVVNGSPNDRDNVKVTHVVFSTFRKIKEILRGYPDGSERTDFHSEEYMFNPVNGDLEEKIIWVPEYMECTIIQIGDGYLYANKGPVACQYRDITNPWKIVSPYVGGWFNDLMGQGLRKTRISRVKPLVHQLNFHYKIIKDREATDIGKVMLMAVNAKPADWSWGKFFAVVRATRFIPLNVGFGGLTAADVQFFKEIDLGTVRDMTHSIAMMTHLSQEMARIMSYNSSMSGTAPASTSVTNNIANLNRAQSQIQSYDEWCDKINAMLIQNGIYLSKQCAKNGNIFIRRALSDLSIATIDIDVDDIDDWILNVQVTNDEIDMQRLDLAKNVIQPYMQAMGENANISAVFHSFFAKSRGELESIVVEMEMERDAANSQAQQVNVHNAQQMQQVEKDLIEWKEAQKRITQAEDNEANKEIAALQSMTIANANDINQDNENDFAAERAADREVKKDKVNKDYQIALKELELEADKIRKGFYNDNRKLRIDDKKANIEDKKVKVLAKKPKAK